VSDELRSDEDLLRLQGSSLRIAVLLSVWLIAGAGVAGVADRLSGADSSMPLLQDWTLIPQALAASGLGWLAYKRGCRAFWILGGLIGLIAVEEQFHILNPVAAWLDAAAQWTRQRIAIPHTGLSALRIYMAVAMTGFLLLALSYLAGSASERLVVRNVSLLLVLGGIFGGPVSVLSAALGSRNWQTAEESGEAVVFAIIAGYVGGLIALVAARSLHDRGDAGESHGESR